VRAFILATVACLSACSWFTPKKIPPPDPPEIIVTGAPVGSLLFVDGKQIGQAAAAGRQQQVIDVAAGEHKVEIHVGDAIVYREDTYVGIGGRSTVHVLSGTTR
jgi:hypothetical protein